jgi:hypothetical protein
MEIREGMIFNCGEETHTVSWDNKIKIWFSNPSIRNQWTVPYLLDQFQSNRFKLIHYPYQVGDWVYDIAELYIKSHNTPKICQITEIEDDKIFVNNERQGLTLSDFNKEYRPCFQDEIPINQIIKEDMEYLIPLINKLNE